MAIRISSRPVAKLVTFAISILGNLGDKNTVNGAMANWLYGACSMGSFFNDQGPSRSYHSSKPWAVANFAKAKVEIPWMSNSTGGSRITGRT